MLHYRVVDIFAKKQHEITIELWSASAEGYRLVNVVPRYDIPASAPDEPLSLPFGRGPFLIFEKDGGDPGEDDDETDTDEGDEGDVGPG